MMENLEPKKVAIHIKQSEGEERTLFARRGEILREVLLRGEASPYRGRFRQMNCRGLGICGSCQVVIEEAGEKWKRRSCQIRCFQDLEIEIR